MACTEGSNRKFLKRAKGNRKLELGAQSWIFVFRRVGKSSPLDHYDWLHASWAPQLLTSTVIVSYCFKSAPSVDCSGNHHFGEKFHGWAYAKERKHQLLVNGGKMINRPEKFLKPEKLFLDSSRRKALIEKFAFHLSKYELCS